MLNNVEIEFHGVKDPHVEKRIAALINHVAACRNVYGITIDFDVSKDFGYDAEAGVADYEEDVWDPCQFTIVVDESLFDLKNEDDEEKLLTTIAHEMIHICQYADGDIVIDGKNYFWMGELYRSEHLHGKINLAEYYMFPWEVEAYGLERGMYHSFLESEQIVDKLLALN